MSPRADTASAWPAGFPRVSGDEPPTGVVILQASQFSPRERG